VDTSIIVVIAIVVVFAVAVPAMIRKSATELSRVEIDSIPDNAAVVPAETPIPGHDHAERTQVFRDKPRKTPSVPTPQVRLVEEAPNLSLTSTPEFSVIDGQAEPTTIAEAAEHSQQGVMPIAVGETHSAVQAEHEATGSAPAGQGRAGVGVGGATNGGVGSGAVAGNVRMLHPAVHAVFNDSSRQGGSQTGSHSGQARPTQSHPPHTQSPAGSSAAAGGRSAIGQPPRGSAPRTGDSGTDRGGNLGEGVPKRHDPQNFHPNVGDDEEHAMTEQETTLRESLKSLGKMVRGFALVFLGSVLGILVTGVLALFSVVHIALAGVFLGLAIVSLFLVRTLNLRKASVKKQLRRLERAPKAGAKAGSNAGSKAGSKPQAAPATEQTVRVKQQQSEARETAPAQTRTVSSQSHTTAAQTRTAPGQSRTAPSQAQNTKEQATPAHTTDRGRTAERPAASAPTSSGTAARIAAAAQGRNASTKAAQARAAMAHHAESKKAREEADTGEIPLVRIRKEATEGHSTRQVLLTGPIPVVEEETSAEAPADSASGSASRGASRAAETKTAGEAQASGSTPNVTAKERSVSAESAEAKGNSGSTESAKSDSSSAAKAEEKIEAPVSLGSDLVDEAPETALTKQHEADADVHAALDAASPKVDDPFMQRLKSRDGWSPTPLPVPSYVDAPEAEHPVPAASAADASSYETEARSREDIAAQFAEELGYRPELSDSAREEGPLGHGRKATRTTKAADLGAVNDVLARRRA
jgi:hypothetical protein